MTAGIRELCRLDGRVDPRLSNVCRTSRGEALLNAAEAVVSELGALHLTLDAVADRRSDRFAVTAIIVTQDRCLVRGN